MRGGTHTGAADRFAIVFMYRWMSHPGLANYDLVLIYYGSNADYQCDFCLEVRAINHSYDSKA